MSTLVPNIYPPYPVVAAELAELPRETPPVEEVEAAGAVRAVESEEQRTSDGALTEADALAISEMARTVAVAAEARSDVNSSLQATADAFDPVLEGERIRNNRSIRELLASFADYDNSDAQARYASSLSVAGAYGANSTTVSATTASTSTSTADEGDGVEELREKENKVYYELGFYPAGDPDRAEREEMEKAVDRWLEGNGIFVPSMLAFPSSDGFRFTPLTENARAALRSADILSSYDRNRTAAYLREMAELTPNDFMFYDPTGLGALSLEERRDFLARVERLLEEAGAERRAAELQYAFDRQDRLDVNRMAIDDEAERIRIESLSEQISGYYGALMQSIRQYSAGVISSSLT